MTRRETGMKMAKAACAASFLETTGDAAAKTEDTVS